MSLTYNSIQKSHTMSVTGTANTNMTETTGWTHEQELLLQNWGEKSQGHSWLHKRSEKYYGKRANAIAIPTSIVAGLSGSVQMSLINDDSANFWVKLATALSTISVSLLSILQKSLNYQSLEERHRKMAIDFSSLHRDISAELSIPASERQNSKEYIALCRSEMDKLTKASPNVPDTIIEDFNEKFGDSKVHKPNMAEGVQPIILYDRTVRVKNYYKLELNRKLHMQKIFYKWKAAMEKYREEQDQVAVDISETEPLISETDPESEPNIDTTIDIDGDNIELVEKDT